MGEWPYAKEPFDTKLFVLLFAKKIGLIIIAALVGGLLIGGGYYLKKVTFGGPVQYDITTTYYIEYAHQSEETGELYDYINDATWKSWVVTDWFVDRAWEYALEAGFEPEKYDMKKADLKEYFKADLPSDIRIPTSTVTTPYEEATRVLNAALQKTFIAFDEDHDEMSFIKVIDETALAEADQDVRLGKAAVLGGVLGAFVAMFVVACSIIWDDTIRIPETFTYRYGVPMAGYKGKGTEDWNEDTKKKLQCLLKERKPLELTVDQVLQINSEELQKAEAIVLLVRAGEDHGKAIEHALHELQVMNCKAEAALLTDADDKLIQIYRFGKKG